MIWETENENVLRCIGFFFFFNSHTVSRVVGEYDQVDTSLMQNVFGLSVFLWTYPRLNLIMSSVSGWKFVRCLLRSDYNHEMTWLDCGTWTFLSVELKFFAFFKNIYPDWNQITSYVFWIVKRIINKYIFWIRFLLIQRFKSDFWRFLTVYWRNESN